jgi:hypothetical protein
VSTTTTDRDCWRHAATSRRHDGTSNQNYCMLRSKLEKKTAVTLKATQLIQANTSPPRQARRLDRNLAP